MLTIYNGFHPKNNVDRLYLLRCKGDRRLTGVQDTMETTILGLKNYVRNSKVRLLIAARTIEDHKDRESPYEYKKMKKNESETQWSQKKNYMNNLSGKQGVKQRKIGEGG